jgi:SAM-dependent methyltransferase
MVVRINTTSYYNETANTYDSLHDIEPEHTRALERAWPLVARLALRSALDVGCGTGRSMKWLRDHAPELALSGIDPANAMLNIARQTMPDATLDLGKAEHLPYADGSFDLVVATGIMHHVDRPSAVISEMLRVAGKAIVISDHNNFAFGGAIARRVRMGLRVCGLLKAATFIKQGFRAQGYSQEDGWWYPYSLLDNYAEIARGSGQVYLIPTSIPTGNDANMLFAQSHLAIVAIKSPSPNASMR